MVWLNCAPHPIINVSINRMMATATESRLTYHPVFNSPIIPVRHGCRQHWRRGDGGAILTRQQALALVTSVAQALEAPATSVCCSFTEKARRPPDFGERRAQSCRINQ